MIVKIKNGQKDCWSYFEGDNIIIHKLNVKSIEMAKDTTYFLDYEIGNKTNKIQLFIQKENRTIARLCSNLPTYLMSDNGKTIDKLI